MVKINNNKMQSNIAMKLLTCHKIYNKILQIYKLIKKTFKLNFKKFTQPKTKIALIQQIIINKNNKI